MRFTYKNVFSKYKKTLSDHMAELSYNTYKSIRMSFKSIWPLKPYEEHILEDAHFFHEAASPIPDGYSLIDKRNEPGYVNLEYIDFFDYLPKEKIASFKRWYKKCFRRYGSAPFSGGRSNKDFDKLDNWGQFSDNTAFSNLGTIKLTSSNNIGYDCSQMSISFRNLSSTFVIVKYRFYVTPEFNKRLNAICSTPYQGKTEAYRPFGVPWYRPRKFGRSIIEGDNVRQEEYYKLLSDLKWRAFKEIRKSFTVQFAADQVFPPIFETYSTNIRPHKDNEKRGFWHSILFGVITDYAPEYNACVCWDYEGGKREGMRLAAYCGGNYSMHSHLPEIAQHELADFYAVYMVASTLRRVANSNISESNKAISNVIRKGRTSKILKTRVAVERKLYYSYRFVSEFSGDTIDYSDVKELKSDFFQNEKEKSSTILCFKGISSRVTEIKELIDGILKLLDDAAEYRSSEANMLLQWIMLVLTVLSLLVAILTIITSESDYLKIIEYLSAFLAQ